MSITERSAPFRVGMIVEIDHPQSGWFHQKVGAVKHSRHDGLGWMTTVMVHKSEHVSGEMEFPAHALRLFALCSAFVWHDLRANG